MDVDACYRCKPFVLQCSPVERASRSLAETGLFFHVFQVLFSLCFLFVFWKVLEGSFGARMTRFGSILKSFRSHFCELLGIRWISESVRFTIVKHKFFRFGRVLIPDFFRVFFLSASFEHSSMTFVDFVGSQGFLRDPNGSHFGSLRGHIWV